jgi:hypothetical protein
MAVTIEIAYFNSIVIAGGIKAGSAQATGLVHVEESRIKGEFNGKQMDYGARAHVTNERYAQTTRPNTMIYSGIFNSRTDFNGLNQFPIAEEITRSVDLSHGSIQKLHAEDTNLNIFQENKVNRALIDKDAIYTAEGQPITTAGANVIGQITPYSGKYGISKNPESFAVFANRKYFADKDRGVVCRLSGGSAGGDGITPISMYGMKDFFKDNLILCDNIYGSFDEQKQKYVISLQGGSIDGGKISKSSTGTSSGTPSISTAVPGYRTLCYDEKVQGWPSFYTYKPTFGVSLDNEYYTFNGSNMYRHYDTSVQRGIFYDQVFPSPAYVKFLFNDEPSAIKTFLTLNYEGTTGWSMESMSSSGYLISGYTSSTEATDAYIIPSEGTIDGGNTIGFVKKENKYFSELRNKAIDFFQDQEYFNTTGIKGYYVDVDMQYWHPTEAAEADKAELFAVGSEAIVSSK